MTAQQHADLRKLIRREIGFQIKQRGRLQRHEITKRMHDEIVRLSEQRIFNFIESCK
jgi:hypothetical protein